MKHANTVTTTATLITLSLFVFTGIPSAAAAEGSRPEGIEIAKRINARDEGEAVSRKLTMEMVDRRGKKRVRETRGYRKYFGTEKRTVIFYLQPKNVKGIGFMTYDYPDANRDDDQWLYLPAMRKVRRISAGSTAPIIWTS
jgi:hypothetical protein